MSDRVGLFGWRKAVAAGVAASAMLAIGCFAVASTAGAASAPACTTSGLVVWLNTMGNGAAGSIYYQLQFTNLSRHTCTLTGYPGVSAIGLSGRQVGAAASRNAISAPRTVTLRPGAGASATLQIVEAGNFPRAACGPVTAAGLRVYPPNQRASKVVPFPFAACSRGASGVLRIAVVH
jgi:hypothetical protein